MLCACQTVTAPVDFFDVATLLEFSDDSREESPAGAMTQSSTRTRTGPPANRKIGPLPARMLVWISRSSRGIGDSEGVSANRIEGAAGPRVQSRSVMSAGPAALTGTLFERPKSSYPNGPG